MYEQFKINKKTKFYVDITFDRSRVLTWFLNAVRESAILIDLWSFDQM